MTRIAPAARDMIPEKYRAAFDEVATRRGRGGPMAFMAYSPEMARRVNQLANYLKNEPLPGELKNESALPKKLIELVILIVARHCNAQFVWDAHVNFGRQAGLGDALIKALQDKKPIPANTPVDEAIVVGFGTGLLQDQKVGQKTFDAALKQFGPQMLAELTVLVGFQVLLAFVVATFEIDSHG